MAGRTRSGPRPSESAGLTELFSSSVSERKPVTTVRADYEFAIAFRVPPPPPSPVPPPPRRLEGRCGGRHFFHGCRADRSGARARSTSNRKPSRQAEKEECVAHEYLPESFPVRQRRRFPLVPRIAVRRASNPVGICRVPCALDRTRRPLCCCSRPYCLLSFRWMRNCHAGRCVSCCGRGCDTGFGQRSACLGRTSCVTAATSIQNGVM